VAAFLVMLRGGVEAALIVAILLGYLRRIDRADQRRWVWLGTAGAVLVSLIAGVALWSTIGELTGTAERLVEGTVALAAVSLLTWMIFWMARQARDLRGRLEMRVDVALTVGSTVTLASIAFVAVAREGLESALFLISTLVGTAGHAVQLLGGLLGLLGAATIGYVFYRGSTRVDLRRFFRITGGLLILFAAGLVVTAVHEFQEIGVLPTFAEHMWRVAALDPAVSPVGAFLQSLFGWRAAPSLLMAAAYLGYLLPVGWAFARMTRIPAARRVVDERATT